VGCGPEFSTEVAFKNKVYRKNNFYLKAIHIIWYGKSQKFRECELLHEERRLSFAVAFRQRTGNANETGL
jgi:hypothetical protein